MSNLNTYLGKRDKAGTLPQSSWSVLSYGDKISKKPQKIHVAVQKPTGVCEVLQGNKRCKCGGHTLSTIWSGYMVMCHHCGKQYVRTEITKLSEDELLPNEVEDREIFSVLLAGGDLREHAVKNVLVLKNHAGVPQRELPLAYAQHIADTYKYADVVTLYHKVERAGKQNITFVRPGA